MPSRPAASKARRRSGVLASSVVLAVLLIASCADDGRGGPGDTAATEAAVPPNLVLVLLDNLDATTSPYWEAMPATESLMADRGLTFTNAFASDPICCPARASILTGRYAHNHGVMTNGGPNGGWRAFHDRGGEERAFPLALQQKGYRTTLIGKYLNGYEAEPTFVPPGWDEWYVDVDTNTPDGFGYTLNENGTLHEYGSAEADYNTDVFARLATASIERASADGQPFFLFLAPTAPHLPIGPAPRHADHPWVNATVPRSPNTDEADLSDKPEWLRRSEPTRRGLGTWNDLDYRSRMGSLLAVDEMVASVYDILERTGQADNTYVVFGSDNGYNLGAHTLIHMMAPYEESIRVPLVVTGPGIEPGEDDRMVLLHDLAPTFLDLGGAPVPDDVDGRSLVPLLVGDDTGPWRTDFLLEYETGWAHRGFGWGLSEPEYFAQMILGGQDIPSYRGVRTATHTYIEWTYDDGSGRRTESELYDLDADPYQLDNLLATDAGRNTNAALVEQLRERLAELAACAGPACR